MGIPLYFRYLINNYDNIISKNDSYPTTDNLYLDLNCGIHYCCREVLKEHPYSKQKQNSIEHRMIQNVVKYIEILVKFSNPQELLYIAIDGPAPKAKMVQQRQRRFKKFYERHQIEKIQAKHGIDTEKTEEWDTNCITPGTIFMDKLATYLKKSLPKNPLLKNIKIIINDSNIPGEGEHKLLHHLKSNYQEYVSNNPDTESKTDVKTHPINVIYGLDADLIMLCISSQVPNILLLREAVEFNNTIHVKGYKFLYLRIDRLKDNLISEIMYRMDRDHLSAQQKKMILDDYIFFSFLLGNDFIPHSPSLSIKGGGIDLVIDFYVRYYDELKVNLVNVELKKINHDFLKGLFYDLGLVEDSLLQDFTKKRNKKRPPNKIYEEPVDRELDLLNFYPQFNRKKEIYINPGEDEWKSRFYDSVFMIEDKYEIDKICHQYLEGIFWNFHYYNYGCISWEWNFPYSQPPSFRDVYLYLHNFVSNINHLDIPKARPFKPYEQLLMVLPAQSRELLPKSYQTLMVDPMSDIIEYYPKTYEIETTYKYYLWECQPILPYIISSQIKELTKSLRLTTEEKERNKMGKIFTSEKKKLRIITKSK